MSATTTIRVMPIWTLERKRDWLSSRRNAARAPALPFSAMAARRGRREETTASSAMAKKPFNTIRQAMTPSSRAGMAGQWQEEGRRGAPHRPAAQGAADGTGSPQPTRRMEPRTTKTSRTTAGARGAHARQPSRCRSYGVVVAGTGASVPPNQPSSHASRSRTTTAATTYQTRWSIRSTTMPSLALLCIPGCSFRPALSAYTRLEYAQQGLRGCYLGTIGADALGQPGIVLLALASGRIVVEEGQEGVALAPGHGPDLVQQRAGEDDAAAGRRAVAPRAEFREAKIAALVALGVEVDRDGKTTVRGAERRVVAVGLEVPAGLRRVAADEVALHAGGAELEALADLGHQPAL